MTRMKTRINSINNNIITEYAIVLFRFCFFFIKIT